MFVSQNHQVGPEDVKTDPDITVETPKIPDLTIGPIDSRVGATNPLQENKSLEKSTFYQDVDITKPLSILTVQCCMLIC